MKLEDYFITKNRHKDILLSSSASLSRVPINKEKVFKIIGDYIYIGEEKFLLEDLLLNKIPLTDNVLETIEAELQNIVYKFIYSKKYKQDLINTLDRKMEFLDKLITNVLSNRNDKVIDVLSIINHSYKNLVTTKTMYLDNILLDKNDYLFFNGERIILGKSQYKINELSQNYKVEIVFPKGFVSYVSFNDILKTLDTFKIYFINGSTQVKFVKEFNLSEKVIQVNKTCTKIIVEGLGASEITNDIILCIGENQTNSNRGIAVLECDFSKSKIMENYHISAHDDIKIFAWKKEEVDFMLPYNEFKAKYYSLDKLVDTNIKTNVNLIDNFLVLFVETDNFNLKQIKIYGVD